MEEEKGKTELVTFMCNPNYDKGIKLRATMKGKTKSAFYRHLIKEYLKLNN